VPKAHTKPIKRTRKWFNKESKGITEGCPGLAHRTVRCATGQCPVHQGTRRPTLHLREFSEGSAIIHRTVRCTTGQCPVLQRRVTLNSRASGIRSAIIHRTCPVSQRSNDYFAPTVDCRRIECAPARAEVRAREGSAPDNLQGLSGAPPDSHAGPQDRAPTVGTQRPGDVAGAPDTVRCAMRHQPPPNG
jgi:hypothetical protein